MKAVFDILTMLVAGNSIILAGIAADRRDWKWVAGFLSVGSILFWVASI